MQNETTLDLFYQKLPFLLFPWQLLADSCWELAFLKLEIQLACLFFILLIRTKPALLSQYFIRQTISFLSLLNPNVWPDQLFLL